MKNLFQAVLLSTTAAGAACFTSGGTSTSFTSFSQPALYTALSTTASSHRRSLLLRQSESVQYFPSPKNMSEAVLPSSLPSPTTRKVEMVKLEDVAQTAPATTTTASAAVANNQKTTPFPIVLWKFTRPHTLIGSALAIPALHMLAAPSFAAAFSRPNAIAAVFAMIPSLLMNLYITGLNQMTDVEIDRINKPNLPIASGELSMKAATVTVVASLIGSLALGLSHPALGSNGLNVALWGSALLGTLYSLPPFRLKRFPLLAAFCIVAVRGTIINAGFFAHARSAAFGVSSATAWNCLLTNPACGLSSLFFGIFGVVIALMKDVPDVRGDAISNVRTFSVRVGQGRIFHAMKSLLMGLFGVVSVGFVRGAVLAPPSTLLMTCRGIVGVAALAAAVSIQTRARGVNPEDPPQVYAFYMHLWKLFYLSYLALPLVR